MALADDKKIMFRESIIDTDKENIRAILEPSKFFSKEEKDIALELLEERLTKGLQSGYNFLFAEYENKMVGYICFGKITGTDTSFNIYWMAVRDDLRGIGIGKKILSKAEDIIFGMGGIRVYLQTSSREQYLPTQKFYQKSGYRKEAFLKDYYSDGDGQIIYLKILNNKKYESDRRKK
ncbi:MAG: GNAT family N-acetyltransferase [bacterium]